MGGVAKDARASSPVSDPEGLTPLHFPPLVSDPLGLTPCLQSKMPATPVVLGLGSGCVRHTQNSCPALRAC